MAEEAPQDIPAPTTTTTTGQYRHHRHRHVRIFHHRATAAPAEAAPATPLMAVTIITTITTTINTTDRHHRHRCQRRHHCTRPAGGGFNINMQNANPGDRCAFKVNSNNNEHYHVNPVFGFVEPGVVAQVEVTRLSGPAVAAVRLEILFEPVDAGLADPKAPFADGAAAEHEQHDVIITAA